jgi:hypothetical protein
MNKSGMIGLIEVKSSGKDEEVEVEEGEEAGEEVQRVGVVEVEVVEKEEVTPRL